MRSSVSTTELYQIRPRVLDVLSNTNASAFRDKENIRKRRACGGERERDRRKERRSTRITEGSRWAERSSCRTGTDRKRRDAAPVEEISGQCISRCITDTFFEPCQCQAKHSQVKSDRQVRLDNENFPLRRFAVLLNHTRTLNMRLPSVAICFALQRILAMVQSVCRH